MRQRGRDDCLEQREIGPSLPVGPGWRHALGESQVSGHAKAGSDASVMMPRPPNDDALHDDSLPEGDNTMCHRRGPILPYQLIRR